MNRKLENRVAVVTGGSAGIGFGALSVSPRKALECSSLAVANPNSTVKFTQTV
jgi:hypothetical protein